MNEFINELILNSEWFLIGVALAIGIPVLVIILNEISDGNKKKSRQFARPIRSLKNIVLPFGAALLILTQMLDFERSSTTIKILETALWILIINVLIAVINSFFIQEDNDGNFKSKVPQLFMDILRVALVLLGGAIVLSNVWGADLNGLITALGLGSFVLGLALQDTLGNLFTGIALVYEKPFREGDVIEVDGTFGKVIEMNWRAIRLETIRGDMVVMPHLMIGQTGIKNYNEPERAHYMTFEIGFDYHIPPGKIKSVLTPVCLNTPFVLSDPPPAVKVIEYKDSVVLYEIEFAIDDFWMHEEILDDLMTRCWYAIYREKLAIPINQWVDHFPFRGLPKDHHNSRALQKIASELPKILPIKKENTHLLIDHAALEYFGTGEYVLKQGDETNKIFIVLAGKALLFHENHEGIEDQVTILGKGDIIGEIALFSSRRNTFSARANSDLKLLQIRSNDIMGLIEKEPKLARYLDQLMDARRELVIEIQKKHLNPVESETLA